VIPLRAVEYHDGLAGVHVSTANGVESRPVQLGVQDGLNIEVTEGLREGEEIVY